MKKDVIAKLSKSFEDFAHMEERIEYWMARDLQQLLEYKDWDNFLNVLEKAKQACQNSHLVVNDHFRDVTEMINVGKGAQRSISNVKLTRYACYLTAQNGDPRRYWSNLKIQLSENEGFAQLYSKTVQLKLMAPDGKMRETDTANTETIFRIIQSIPSPKAA